jgi:lipopolysaccharide export system protein LptA
MERTVWTPKRVLMLAMGFALFFTAYMVYAYFLGGINGLPPLPDYYLPIADDNNPIVLPNQENEADRKLRIAFGPDCDEVKNRNIKVELQSRGMVLAAQDIKFEEGRVKLMPFSIAIFGKDRDGDQFPEINTIQCQEAKLAFDKEVKNIADMANRKITGGQLSGDIKIINNRHTPQRDDDLSLFTQGPLYYEESMHRVWTGADVEMIDLQSKPKPMNIRGKRMHLYLAADNKPGDAGAAAPAKAKAGSPMKAERIELESDVDMNLWVDPRSGFLNAGKEDKGQGKTAPADGKSLAMRVPGSQETVQAEKAKVEITTQGPFRYDLLTDRATFDISHHPGPGRNVVTVDRFHELEGKNDRIESDHLEIQFQRKNPAAAKTAREDHGEGLDIETVRATGKEVILTSDAEVLEAHGNDFFYDKKTHLSILKGQPRMWALWQGNEIEAPELQLLDVKGAQQATALGEGYIRMLDKKTGDRPLEAHWKNKLVYGKDGAHDLLSLVGDASFVDHEHAQQLQAQQLKVWLEPSKEGKARPGNDPQRPLPHHVDALGKVKAVAADMRVHDTDHLVLWFKDVASPATPLPATQPVSEVPPADAVATKSVHQEPNLPVTSSEAGRPAGTGGFTAAKPIDQAVSPLPRESQGAPAPAAARPATANPAKPKKPMDLSARYVEAHVVRSASKNELDKLWCEGTVRVVQESSGPDDKGVDIRGEKLELVRQADGNILRVLGDYAQVQLDKLHIVGPEVNIDQTINEASVNGMGVMRLPSNANFAGTKPTQPADTTLAPPADITIYWEEHMRFDGQVALFDWPSDPRHRRGVRAEQNNGHLACRAMHVTLDRKISLREGDKGKQPAKVEKIVCDKEVWLEDSKREGSRVVGSDRIECPVLAVDNSEEKDDSVVNAGGPGTVRIFQLGTKGELLASGGASGPSVPASGNRGATNTSPAKGKRDGEFKLTRVTYQNRMYANNKKGIATFYDKVVLIHVPTDDPNLQIDENRLPPGYLYMSCEKLEVLKNKLPDGRTYQEMRAFKKVAIESQEFSGNAEVVKYDESKEQVILEGSDGNLAELIKQKVHGGEPDKVIGKKITYWRSTGEYQVEQGRGVRVGQ